MSSMFWVSPEGGLQNLSEQPVSVLCHSYSKECFPHIQVDLPVFQFVPIALPTIMKFHWQSVFKIFVCFYEIPSQLPLLQANKPSSLRLSSQEKCPSLIIFVPLVFLNYQAQNWTHHLSQHGHSSFDSVKIWLPFSGIYRHCWLASNCLSTDWMKTPFSKSFSVELLSVRLSSSLSWYWGLPQPGCSTLYLALLDFMRFPWAHSSSQSGSSGCHPFPIMCQLNHFMSSPNLLRVHHILLSVPLIRILSSMCPHKDLESITPHSLLRHWAIYCSSLEMIIQKNLHPTLPLSNLYLWNLAERIAFDSPLSQLSMWLSNHSTYVNEIGYLYYCRHITNLRTICFLP